MADKQGERREVRLTLRSVGVGTFVGYAALWMVFLFVVLVALSVGVHAILSATGALTAVSQMASTLLGDPLPKSGVMPWLTLGTFVKWTLLGGGGLAVLGVLLATIGVLVHNLIVWVMGGVRLTLRD